LATGPATSNIAGAINSCYNVEVAGLDITFLVKIKVRFSRRVPISLPSSVALKRAKLKVDKIPLPKLGELTVIEIPPSPPLVGIEPNPGPSSINIQIADMGSVDDDLPL
jgi:hypothetical protein